jgi:hypothetical protein
MKDHAAATKGYRTKGGSPVAMIEARERLKAKSKRLIGAKIAEQTK